MPIQQGFARLIIIVVIAIALIFGFRVASEHFLSINPIKSKESPIKTVSEVFQTDERKGDCKNGEVAKFEAGFTDLEKIEALAPIGTITGGSPGRSYIGVKKGMEAPIYSPTDMVLENIIYAKRPGSDKPGEYGLYFRIGCNVTILFDHLDRLSERIKDLAPEKPAETSRVENPSIDLEVKKGELLAYTDGTPRLILLTFF